MSLLGRLEDLSLTDIIQIVFLSRRTGVLEIIDSNGRHSVVFQQGMLVNASSPALADLGVYLERAGLIAHEVLGTVRQAETAGVPLGTALLDMNVLPREQLADAVRQHILNVVNPLLTSREGEFNFILSESLSAIDIGYDPPELFKEGGIPPARILGEGEKLKPLRGLEESMRAGKELLRSSSTGPSTGKLELGFSDDIARAAPAKAAARAPQPAYQPEPPNAAETDWPEEQAVPLPPAGLAGEVFPSDDAEEGFAALEEEPFDIEAAAGHSTHGSEEEAVPEPSEAPPGGETLATLSMEAPDISTMEFPDDEPQDGADGAAESVSPMAPAGETKHPSAPFFKVADSGKKSEKTVVLYQRDPLLRVSARRAFNRRGMTTAQYGSLADVREAVSELLHQSRIFVTFLDIGDSLADVAQLLQFIKRKNHRLPVVLIDELPDLRRRHDLLKLGADLYLTKPSEGHLQPGMVEEQLALFADELVLFAQRSFTESAAFGGGTPDAIYEVAGREKGERSTQLLMRLINELSDPNDISQVSQTILRLASQYLERGALFAAATIYFVGLGGFGAAGGGEDVNDRARSIRIGRTEQSVLNDVLERRSVHRGKLRKTAGNVRLVEGLGRLMPNEVVVLPILNKDEVVGVLYGDNAVSRARIDEVKGLEIFLAQSGFALLNAMIANRGRYGLE